MVFYTVSIVLKVTIALQLQFPILFWHSERVAIVNLLCRKLCTFSSLLSRSKYVVGVTGAALQFAASISMRKLSAHFTAMAKMVVYLVDSLFPTCALFNHIQTFSALEQARKQKPKRNSKRSINRGAASGERRPPLRPPLHLDSPILGRKPFH
jgi:hypothetical protein